MASDYSFLDIATLNGVRQRFASGEALTVLDEALENVVWTNGQGARLFGYADIEQATGADAGLTAGAKRQIMASAGYHGASGGGQAMVRMGAAVVNLAIRQIVLPDGETGILLAAPDPAVAPTDPYIRAISGFSDRGQFLALIDQHAVVLAATPDFESLDIAQTELADLVADVRTEHDRLVKRPVRGGDNRYPAGIARLNDSPPLHLLVVVDEPIVVSPPAVQATPATEVGKSQPAATGLPPTDQKAVVSVADSSREKEIGATSGLSGWARPLTLHTERSPRSLQRAPVRFLWRTDPQGRFSAISDEFLEAVGITADRIVGRTFGEIADEFDLDADHEIAGLLERRDTWSGRAVRWPVADAWLVPVDLAALPAYDRDRSFEGFRGFGILRFGDAVADDGVRTRKTQAGDRASEEPMADEPGDDGSDQDDLQRLDGVDDRLEAERLPEPAAGDKVVRLAERRQERGLSAVERSAFQEIGNRLRGTSEAEPAAASERVEPQDGPVAAAAETSAHDEDETSPVTAGDAGTHEAVAAGKDAEPAEPADLAEDEGADQAGEPATRRDEARSGRTAEDHSAMLIPLKESAVLDRLPVPVLIHRGDLLLYANPELLDLAGYGSLDNLADVGGLDALLSTPYDGGKSEHRLHLRTRKGETFPIDALLRSVPWNGGSALMLVIRRTGEPATDQESPALTEARVHIAEMRTIIDTATDGVVLIDPDGNIRSVSRPAEALFGFDSDDLAGKPFTSLFATESQRAAREYLAGLADHGVASILNDGREVIGREAQGRFIPLFMTIGRLPNSSGYCAVLRDVTQWKRAEEELSQSRSQAERASSQKSDFLARVSHEIRTPLNAIIGFSELMLDERFGTIANDRYRDYLRDINRSGNHVLDLVNDLLDISKIEAGEQDMSYEAVSLNEVLGEAVAIMQPQANRERVIIRSSFMTRLPEVVADLRSVRQIALNILSNAVRFTPAGGQVIISTSYEPNGDIAMRVRDTGIGMSQAEIEQALKPFKQINALKRPRGDGTGLGLPLTKAMVEANRAKFTLTSAPSEGTLIEILFPSTRVLAQ